MSARQRTVLKWNLTLGSTREESLLALQKHAGGDGGGRREGGREAEHSMKPAAEPLVKIC